MTNASVKFHQAPLDACDKGVPGGVGAIQLDAVALQGWNVLRGDLPMPAALLKQEALRNNSGWMRGFLDSTGARLAPHGKTTMAPSLFDLQLDDGAWAITLSTPHQLHVARRFGYSRIVLANQLVGRSAIAWVIDELKRDPAFEFYCLVDSADNVRELASSARTRGLDRPLRVLVEIGYHGGRTGCRTVEAGLSLAREVRGHADVLALSGIEGFEGIIREPTEAATITKVEAFVDRIVALGQACADEELFAEGLVLFTAGGSAFYDIVGEKLAKIRLRQQSLVLLRAGCYLTHDSLMYTYLFKQLKARAPQLERLGAGLTPALEVWAYVQSLPEPGKAIVAMGKRDISYDHMPVPLVWFRPGGEMPAPAVVPAGHKVTELNDQHAYVSTPGDTPWRVGDLVGFGISHPCLTFDKWRVLHLVDDSYTVTGSLRTYF